MYHPIGLSLDSVFVCHHALVHRVYLRFGVFILTWYNSVGSFLSGVCTILEATATPHQNLPACCLVGAPCFSLNSVFHKHECLIISLIYPAAVSLATAGAIFTTNPSVHYNSLPVKPPKRKTQK